MTVQRSAQDERRSRTLVLPRLLHLLALAGVFSLAVIAPPPSQADEGFADEALTEIAACEADVSAWRVFEDDDDLQTRAVVAEPGLLCVDGDVTASFADWYGARADDFDVVVIRSPGGRGSAGVRTGEAALAAGVRIVVWDYCISACANGFVIGAAHVVVPEPAILAWHGSLPRDRFEALLLTRTETPELRRVQEKLVARFNRTGERRVGEAFWTVLAEDERQTFEMRARWRGRVADLLEARRVNPDFLAASAFAARHAPEATQAYAISRVGSLAPILWVPGPEHLRTWGLDHIETWRPASSMELYQQGLSMTPAMVLTDVELTPGAFYVPLPERD